MMKRAAPVVGKASSIARRGRSIGLVNATIGIAFPLLSSTGSVGCKHEDASGTTSRPTASVEAPPPPVEEPPPPVVAPPIGEDGKPDYQHCQADADCIPIECSCSCSGCGGISYDEMINAKYGAWWRREHACKPSPKPGACPAMCCKQVVPACEKGQCVARPKTGG